LQRDDLINNKIDRNSADCLLVWCIREHLMSERVCIYLICSTRQQLCVVCMRGTYARWLYNRV
jgi:hypothetical protein